ncbi:MAG: hypothetical protein ACREDQ_12675 [Limisphaerales bacterium]
MSEAHEYPKHMYNGTFRNPVGHNGDPEPVFKVVNNHDEENAARAKGWSMEHPAREAQASDANVEE